MSGTTGTVSTAAASASLGSEPASMLPVAHRVLRRRIEVASDKSTGVDEVVTIELEPVEDRLFSPAPGQFYMLWAPRVGEVPISVSSERDGVLGFTIRAVGATTSKLCETAVGGAVGVRGPYGRGWAQPAPEVPMVVVAGGIGLAPFRLHIESLLSARKGSPDPRLILVIGARSPVEFLYPEQIDEWSEHCQVHATVDRPRPGWHGEVGLVTSTLGRLHLADGAAAALCGPEVMMRVAASDLVTAGADPELVEVSMERSMACAVAHCGRCQLGPVMLCRDGPVLAWAEAAALIGVRRW